ncbi:MAG: PspC domain-containing protein [Schleiferiaceae bacterium]
MNQTININLAGMIFHVDENAFALLNDYIERLKRIFEPREGGNEIVQDVESRMAELFQEMLSDSKEVISEENVKQVIATLGNPEDYVDDDEDTEEAYKNTASSTEDKKMPKRLFRNPDDKILGGVASGLAAYFGMDPVWVRLIIVALFLFNGIGLIPYIILWIVIPEASTTAEKLQMKGEPINLSNIEKSVKDEINNVKEKVTDPSLSGKVKRGLDEIVDVIIQIVKFLFTFIGKFLGVILFIVGILILFAFGSLLFGGSIFIGGLDYSSSQLGGVLEMFWVDSAMHYWTLVGMFLIILFPVIVFFMLATRILFNWKNQNRWIYIGGVIVFIIGSGIVAANGIRIAKQFQSTSSVTEKILVETESTVLYTHMQSSDIVKDLENNPFLMDEGVLYSGDVDFDIFKTDGELPYYTVTYKACGENRTEARERAKGLTYFVEAQDSLLLFDGYFEIPSEQKYRAQEINLSLYLPVGYEVFLDESMIEIIYDIKNVHNVYDGDMVDMFWIMTDRGLICKDCPESERAPNDEYEWQDEMEEELEEAAEELERSAEALERSAEAFERSMEKSFDRDWDDK